MYWRFKTGVTWIENDERLCTVWERVTTARETGAREGTSTSWHRRRPSWTRSRSNMRSRSLTVPSAISADTSANSPGPYRTLLHGFYRATLCQRGICCRRVSVRLSVCPTQAGSVPKRQNVGSRKQRHTIAQGLLVFMPKIAAKFRQGHTQCASDDSSLNRFRDIFGGPKI